MVVRIVASSSVFPTLSPPIVSSTSYPGHRGLPAWFHGGDHRARCLGVVSEADPTTRARYRRDLSGGECRRPHPARSKAVAHARVAHTGVVRYVVLYFGVPALWVGISIIGGCVLAAAGVLASKGELNLWLVIVVATLRAYGFGAAVLGRLSARRGRIALAIAALVLRHVRRALVASLRRST